MAWIELHQTLPAHRKIKKLKRLLKIKTPQAVGHVVMLWLWSIDNAPDGDLSQVDAEDIAEACEWPKDAEGFVVALKESALIDEDMRLHDWGDYTGRLVEQRDNKKKKDRERQKRYREKKAETANAPKSVTHANVTRDKSVSHADVTALPDSTGQDSTRQNQTSLTTDVREGRCHSPSRPSSVGEVEAYAKSIGSQASAQRWWDYFQEHDWKLKGEPMTDWRAVFDASHEWRRWRDNRPKPGGYQPTAERIQQNAVWLDSFLDEQSTPEGGDGHDRQQRPPPPDARGAE